MINIHYIWIGSDKISIPGAEKMIVGFDKFPKYKVYFWVLSDEIPNKEFVKTKLPRTDRPIQIVLIRPDSLNEVITQFEKNHQAFPPEIYNILIKGFETLKQLYNCKMYVQAKDLFSFLILYLYGGYYMDNNIQPDNDDSSSSSDSEDSDSTQFVNPSKFKKPSKLQIPCENPIGSKLIFYAIPKKHIKQEIFESAPLIRLILSDEFKNRSDYFFFPRIDLWFVSAPHNNPTALHVIEQFTLFFDLLIPDPTNSDVTTPLSQKFFEEWIRDMALASLKRIASDDVDNEYVKDLLSFFQFIKSQTFPVTRNDLSDSQTRKTLAKIKALNDKEKTRFVEHVYTQSKFIKTKDLLRLSKSIRMRVGLAYSWSAVSRALYTEQKEFFVKLGKIPTNPSKDQISIYLDAIFKHMKSEGIFVESKKITNKIFVLDAYSILKIHSGSWLIS